MKNKLTKEQKIEIKNLKKEFNQQKRLNLKNDDRFDCFRLLNDNNSFPFLILLACAVIPFVFSFAFLKFLPFFLPTIGLTAIMLGAAGIYAMNLNNEKMNRYKELYKKEFEDLNEKIEEIKNGKKLEEEKINEVKNTDLTKIEEKVVAMPIKSVNKETEEELDR